MPPIELEACSRSRGSNSEQKTKALLSPGAAFSKLRSLCGSMHTPFYRMSSPHSQLENSSLFSKDYFKHHFFVTYLQTLLSKCRRGSSFFGGSVLPMYCSESLVGLVYTSASPSRPCVPEGQRHSLFHVYIPGAQPCDYFLHLGWWFSNVNTPETSGGFVKTPTL